MYSKNLKKLFIITFLGILIVSAFYTRLNSFLKNNYENCTIDEIIYYRLGMQLKNDLSDYNIIPYAQSLTPENKELPDYFFQPLFKHPPFFSLCIAFSMKIFGETWLAAEYVSLLFGVFMIPLVYLLGISIFGHRVAILATILLWLDPISIICTQKVWMDTTMDLLKIRNMMKLRGHTERL